MADFCKQCSEDMFGKDFGDLTHDSFGPIWALCEGCGFRCLVEKDGTCVSPSCLKQHGKQSPQREDIAMQEMEIARLDSEGYYGKG